MCQLHDACVARLRQGCGPKLFRAGGVTTHASDTLSLYVACRITIAHEFFFVHGFFFDCTFDYPCEMLRGYLLVSFWILLDCGGSLNQWYFITVPLEAPQGLRFSCRSTALHGKIFGQLFGIYWDIGIAWHRHRRRSPSATVVVPDGP